jgi:hypothetical protein
VVASTSVVSSWVTEAARFTPELRVGMVTDTLARSSRTIDEVAAADGVMDDGNLFASSLTAEDIRGLLDGPMSAGLEL